MPTKAADYLDERTLDGLNKDEPSNRELADGIKLILRKLWSEDDMNGLIDRRHWELCENCPLRAVTADSVRDGAAGPDGDGGGAVTRRTVLRSLKELALETIRAPWFWIPVATGCGILCARYNISLPAVGGGN